MADITVILPHRRNPGNDRALAIALDCLAANTRHDFILLMDAATDKPLYERVNAMVKQATTECCVYTASDMFFAPGWDVPMFEAWDKHTFVTNVVVEPAAISMHSQNLFADFGKRPESFNRAGFESWCQTAPVPDGEGWFAPYMFPRTGWLAHGGLELGLSADAMGFTGADELLFERWKWAGNRVVRARSFVYHLQRWSEPFEQTKEGR